MPTPKLGLNINVRTTKIKRTRFPKNVSKRWTNRPGIANITIQNTTNTVNSPTTKFIFFFENTLLKESIYNICEANNSNICKQTQDMKCMFN
jgi:hypothetical protein